MREKDGLSLVTMLCGRVIVLFYFLRFLRIDVVTPMKQTKNKNNNIRLYLSFPLRWASIRLSSFHIHFTTHGSNSHIKQKRTKAIRITCLAIHTFFQKMHLWLYSKCLKCPAHSKNSLKWSYPIVKYPLPYTHQRLLKKWLSNPLFPRWHHAMNLTRNYSVRSNIWKKNQNFLNFNIYHTKRSSMKQIHLNSPQFLECTQRNKLPKIKWDVSKYVLRLSHEKIRKFFWKHILR